MNDFKSFSLFDPTPQHKALRELLKDFVQKELEPQALESDRNEVFNLKLFRKLGDLGLLGLLVKEEELGGSGMDLTAMLAVHEELGSSDPGFCLSYLAHSVLCVYNIYRNSNEAQKKQWLPKLCSGKAIGAMAMSEPDCGTDTLALQSQAVKQGKNYLLNGRKMWITNGCIDSTKDQTNELTVEKTKAINSDSTDKAKNSKEKIPCDLVLLYAKTGDKLSSFVVEKHFKGFFVGQKITDKLGMRASNTAELVFDNCLVPESHLIGKEGDSLIHMMKNLEVERLALAGISLGIAKSCLNIMNQYASGRLAFNKKIRSFGQIQKYLATSYSQYQAVRTYAYNIARKIKEDSQQNYRLECDSVKLLAGEMGKNIADKAIQVLGGYGYVGEYVVERLWRDAKLLEIGGGTNEALEKNISKELEKQTQ